MNWRSQQNEQESESSWQLPNPFLGLRPIERENRAAAGTTKITLRPANRRGPASPLAEKCPDQIEFDFRNSSSGSCA
jgi:hypothetical protein